MEKVGTIFVDSGAHSLYTKHVINRNHIDGYAFYETDAFWNYVDAYSNWLKGHLSSIDVYANVDVIFNPELSWKVLKYMENTHKLKPLPVIHFNTDMKWVKKHMDNYDYLGIGGIGQEVRVKDYYNFGDKLFTLLTNEKGMPSHKTHGFAIASVLLVFRYPWFSIDSTTWSYFGRYGAILYPKKVHGRFRYDKSPLMFFISERIRESSVGVNFRKLSAMEQKSVIKYINDRGYEMGTSLFKEVPITYKCQPMKEFPVKTRKAKPGMQIIQVIVTDGVTNNHILRDFFNAEYFMDVAKALPEWPWAFKYRQKRGINANLFGW